MRVLLLTSSFPRWTNDDATGRFMLDLAKEMSKEHDLTVLAPLPRGGRQEESMEGVRVVRHKQALWGAGPAYGSGMLTNIRSNFGNLAQLPLFFFFQFRAALKLARKHDIQVINAHWLLPQAAIAVAAAFFARKRIRLVATVHGTDVNGFSGPIGGLLKKQVLKRLDGLVAVSPQLAERVRQLGWRGPLEVSPMGVNTSLFHPGKKSGILKEKFGNRKFVTYVGALIESKGLLVLLDAFRLLCKETAGIRLLLIGEGALRSALETKAREAGLSESVLLLGERDHREIPEIVASSDAFVLPSFAEGFSVCVAEALSCETPVVMTENIGIADALKGNGASDEGLPLHTVPPGDADALAGALRSVLSGGAQVEKMRKRGREAVQMLFDWSIVAEPHRRAVRIAE